jgi:hypothetical protein
MAVPHTARRRTLSKIDAGISTSAPDTGYFIEKAAPPAGTQITLVDPNPNVLSRCSRRLAAMQPTTIEADVTKPLPVDGPFDSAALSYVLHCLRGPQSHKAVTIRNVAALSNPMACCSAAPSWEPPNDIHDRLARSSGPSTEGATSKTSEIPLRGSARSWRSRSKRSR